MSQRFFIQKIVPLALIFSFIFPSIALAQAQGAGPAGAAAAAASGAPARAVAVPVSDLGAVPLMTYNAGMNGTNAINSTQNWLKTWILDPMVSAMGTAILSRVTESIVNWINNGFNGSPSFITDPASFFGNLADGLIGDFIFGSQLGFLCRPFQLQIKLALGYNSNSSAYRPQCSLTQIINNVNNFANNPVSVNISGNVTQTKTYYTNYQQLISAMENPQNNVFGGFVIAQADLRSQLSTQQQRQDQQLAWGRGFLSFKKCTQWSNTPTSSSGATQDMSQEYAPSADTSTDSSKPTCTASEITTPGAMIVDQLNFSLGSQQRKLEVANSLNQIIGALMNVLVQKILTSATGLLGATSNGYTNSYSNQQAFDALQQQMDATYPTYQTQTQSMMNISSTTSSTSTSSSTPVVPITSALQNLHTDTTTSDIMYGTVRYTVNQNVPGTYSTITLLRKQTDGTLSPVSFNSVFYSFTLTASDAYTGNPISVVDVLNTAGTYTTMGFLPNVSFVPGYQTDITVNTRTGVYVSRGDYVLEIDTNDANGNLVIGTDLPFSVN